MTIDHLSSVYTIYIDMIYRSTTKTFASIRHAAIPDIVTGLPQDVKWISKCL